MENEQEQESQALIPIEQQTIMFRGLPLVVVRLPDGRPGVVLRWICENLHLDPGAQVTRIQRTEVIAIWNDLQRSENSVRGSQVRANSRD